MIDIPAEFLLEVERLSASLDKMDYFEILAVGKAAKPAEIRRAYHARSRQFHPDRYHHTRLPRLGEDLLIISKRISEAYVILRDDKKRERYLEGIQGPQRHEKLRYTEVDEQERKTQQETALASTPQGRTFFQAAQKAVAENDKTTAIKHLKMAMMYEPQNPAFKSMIEELSKK